MFSKKFFQEHDQSVKQFGSRSGLTWCQAWSGSTLFSKIISRRHKQMLSYVIRPQSCCCHNIHEQQRHGPACTSIHACQNQCQSAAFIVQCKKGGKDQESIQSSTTPDPGYHMERWQKHKHHKQEPRGQPFPSRRPQGSNEQTWKHDKHKT